MTRIPSDLRDAIEMSIYLPMTISIFSRDLLIIEKVHSSCSSPI